jgi:hypothetical protein
MYYDVKSPKITSLIVFSMNTVLEAESDKAFFTRSWDKTCRDVNKIQGRNVAILNTGL